MIPAKTSTVQEAEWKYPQPPLQRDGTLVVSGHQLHWEEYGNPDGEPVLVVHGGPGGGCSPSMARYFDPARYRIILFDQRGCGKSSPHAAGDTAAALTDNTTDHLIADIVALRKTLRVTGKMHVFGGSWGSTLAMAYAIQHPETVETLILRGIFLCRRKDLDYLYQGNAASFDKDPYDTSLPGTYLAFPEAWKDFVEVIPPAKRGDMVKAYAEIFAMTPTNSEERSLQNRAVAAWALWEGATSHRAPGPGTGKFGDPIFAKAFAQIENHYFMNGAFLGGSGDKNRDNNYLLDNVDKIKDIPVHLVHGRYDQVCPRFQADELLAAFNKVGAKHPVDFRITDAGHSMTDYNTCINLTDVMDTLPPMTPDSDRAAPPTKGPKNGP